MTAVLVTLSAALLLAAVPAAAAPSEGRKPCGRECDFDAPPPTTDTGLDGEEIWASLDVSGQVTGGAQYRSAGRVKVVPRCWYRWWYTGAEYAAFWEGEANQKAMAQVPHRYRAQALPGYQEHALKGAEDGGWYGPWCREGVDGEFLLSYLDTHPPRFFEANEPRPAAAAEVEPRVLAEAAYEAMELPRGTVRWNPSVEGSGATVVNMATWVWVEGAASTATVRATLPSGPWVQVEAVIERVEVTAPGIVGSDDTVRCDDLGVPWTPDADDAGTTCEVVFERSSANQPVKHGREHPTATMVVTTVWSASWTSWLDATPVDLGEQTTTVPAEVPVGEIQTVVTR
ncbi:hypothetical protein J1G42_02815 [Cellulomonas sp. zg-ZUI222]|uniref:Ig-like domain-containing protein n=1 Tax=Cellulomonas wangleii TaxID=2816956 RepID=A0ABX8D5L4_9CELL|nr:hypothetical protein [Cellulomonas wangleii]MBO0919756.1 hypothetical protein [Cellulomonas wangleii]MBO0923818.1 hypothetical protein [Cellulomonas wangleii]MBO0924100.1 hypothetical protein [Cellulomonas wangleii]QVI62125.1 hypothetical protein KG103_17195 [Cellulomonas wangleii]